MNKTAGQLLFEKYIRYKELGHGHKVSITWDEVDEETKRNYETIASDAKLLEQFTIVDDYLNR